MTTRQITERQLSEALQTKINATAAAVWGGITGTLASQTDLKNALDGKAPGAMAMKISLILGEIEPKLKTYHKERITLIEQYGKINKAKGKYDFPNQETEEQFEKEYEQMLAVDVVLNILPLSYADIERMECTAASLYLLRWMIQQPEA